MDNAQEAVTPQAWKPGNQKCQHFHKPHSSSTGKYGPNAKVVSASSWPFSSIERSENQQIKRQFFSEHGGNGHRAGPKQQPETSLALRGKGCALAIPLSLSYDSFPSGLGCLWLRALGPPTLLTPGSCPTAQIPGRNYLKGMLCAQQHGTENTRLKKKKIKNPKKLWKA